MTTLGRTLDSTADPVQKMLDDNVQLIQTIVENQNKGRAYEVVQYQQQLYKNLLYLANLADPNLNIREILPKPGFHMPDQQAPSSMHSQSYSMQHQMSAQQTMGRPTVSSYMGMPSGSGAPMPHPSAPTGGSQYPQPMAPHFGQPSYQHPGMLHSGMSSSEEERRRQEHMMRTAVAASHQKMGGMVPQFSSPPSGSHPTQPSFPGGMPPPAYGNIDQQQRLY